MLEQDGHVTKFSTDLLEAQAELREIKQLLMHGVVFNEAKEIDKQLKSEHSEYIMKANEEVWLYSEVELPNKCKVCGRTDEERLTMTSMCGVSACPY